MPTILCIDRRSCRQEQARRLRMTEHCGEMQRHSGETIGTRAPGTLPEEGCDRTGGVRGSGKVQSGLPIPIEGVDVEPRLDQRKNGCRATEQCCFVQQGLPARPAYGGGTPGDDGAINEPSVFCGN